jgi:hypothetical protein
LTRNSKWRRKQVAKLDKWLVDTKQSYDAIAPDPNNFDSKAYFVIDIPRHLRLKTLGETEA